MTSIHSCLSWTFVSFRDRLRVLRLPSVFFRDPAFREMHASGVPPVGSPSSITNSPLTNTKSMPTGYCTLLTVPYFSCHATRKGLPQPPPLGTARLCPYTPRFRRRGAACRARRQKKGAPQTPRGLRPRHLTLSGKDGGGNQGGTPAPPDAHYGTCPEGLTAWEVKERGCIGVAHRGPDNI